jgi:hypothetical protein
MAKQNKASFGIRNQSISGKAGIDAVLEKK